MDWSRCLGVVDLLGVVDMNKEIIIDHVCAILRSINTNRSIPITPDLDLITQLDLDSLQMLDLVEELNKSYGINFMNEPYSIRDMRTPEAIAAVIVSSSAK